MADAVLPTDPKVMQELLRQRGLLATDGAIRMMPFADDGSGSGSSQSPVTTTTGSATADAMKGASASPFVDPNAPTPQELAAATNAPESEVGNWLPWLLGAGAATAGALALRKLLAGRGIKVPDVAGGGGADPLAPLLPGIETVEGTVEPNARLSSNVTPVEGVYTDATPKLTTGAAQHDEVVRALGGTTKALPAPAPNTIEVGATPPKYLTARTMAERRIARQGTPTPSGPAIAKGDDYSDVAPDEIKKIRQIANELIARRQAGNAAGTGQAAAKEGLPFGLADDPKAVINDIVRVLRQNKGLRALGGRIP